MLIEEIEKKLINQEPITKEEVKILINHAINELKKQLNDKTFSNKCDLAQGVIGNYLKKLNVKIYPNITNKCISQNVVGHSFLIADFNESGKYIIDPAFIQFFYDNDKYEELYIKDTKVKSKSPFYYGMRQNPEILKELLKNGFLELNEENKNFYGNCFYYTLTNIPKDYQFKKKDYNFLQGNEPLNDYGLGIELKTQSKKETR